MAGLPRVSSYLKNVGKSISYSAIDYLKDTGGATAEFVDTNKELFKDIYGVVVNYRQTLKKIDRSIKASKPYEAAQIGWQNIKEDLKTGNFYNREREERLGAEAMGFDFSDFNDDFSEEMSPSNVSTKDVSPAKTNTEIVEDAIATASHAQSKVLSSSVSYIAEVSKVNTKLQVMTNEKLLNAVSSGFNGVGGVMEKMNAILEGPMKTHMENSTTYYQETTKLLQEQNAMMKEFLEMQRNLYIAQDKKPKANDFDEVVGAKGTPNLKEYGKVVKKNVKNQMSMLGLDMIFGNSIGDGNMLKLFVGSPLKFITESIVKTIVPNIVKESIESLDEGFGTLFTNLMNKLAYNGKKNQYGMMGLLADIFGLKPPQEKKTMNLESVNRGPIPFDGDTKLAIVETIPTYLRRIESVLTGMPERMQSPEDGKWITTEEARKKYEQKRQSRVASATYELNAQVEKQVLSKMDKFTTDKDTQNNIRRAFNEKVLPQIYKDGFLDLGMNLDEAIEKFKFYDAKEAKDSKKNKIYRNFFDNLWSAFSAQNEENKEMVSAIRNLSANINNAKIYSNKEMEQMQSTIGDVNRQLVNNSSYKTDEFTGDFKARYVPRLVNINTNTGGKKPSQRSRNRGSQQSSVRSYEEAINVADSLSADVKGYRYHGVEEMFKAAEEDRKAEKERKRNESFIYRYFDDHGIDPESGDVISQVANQGLMGGISLALAKVHGILMYPSKKIVSMLDKADKKLFSFVFGKNEKYKIYDKEGNHKEGGFLDYIVYKTTKTFEEAGEKINKIFDSVSNRIKQSRLWESATKLFDSLKDNFMKAFGTAFVAATTAKFKGAFGGIKGSVSDVFNEARGGLERQSIKNIVKDNPYGLERLLELYDEDRAGLLSSIGGLSGLRNAQKQGTVGNFISNIDRAKDTAGLAEVDTLTGEDTSIVDKYANQSDITSNILNRNKEKEEEMKKMSNNQRKKEKRKQEKIQDDISEEQEGLLDNIAGINARGGKVRKGGLTFVSPGEIIVPSSTDPKVLAKQEKQELDMKRKMFGANDDTPTKAKGDKKGKQIRDYLDDIISKIDKEDIKKKKDSVVEALPDVAASGVLGGAAGLFIGGPVLGALVGVAKGIIDNSQTAQNFIFGKEVMENGRKVRKGGFVPEYLTDIMNKYAPDFKKYGIAGAVAGLITPLGPIGGLMVGASISFMKNNESFKRYMFGDEENEGLISVEFQKQLKKASPAMARGAAMGAVASFIGPFGLLGGAAMGAGLGLFSTTSTFTDLLLGKEDENGERDGGLVKALKDVVIDPITETIKETTKSFKDYFQKNIIDNMKQFMSPFAQMIKNGINEIVDHFKEKSSRAFEKFVGGPLVVMFKKLFGPIGSIANKLLKTGIGAAKGVAAAPFKALGRVGENIEISQLKKGSAAKSSAAQRLARREYFKNKRSLTGLGTSSDKAYEIDKLLSNASEDQIIQLNDVLTSNARDKAKIEKQYKEKVSNTNLAANKLYEKMGLRKDKKGADWFTTLQDISKNLINAENPGSRKFYELKFNQILNAKDIKLTDEQKEQFKNVYNFGELRRYNDRIRYANITNDKERDELLRKIPGFEYADAGQLRKYRKLIGYEADAINKRKADEEKGKELTPEQQMMKEYRDQHDKTRSEIAAKIDDVITAITTGNRVLHDLAEDDTLTVDQIRHQLNMDSKIENSTPPDGIPIGDGEDETAGSKIKHPRNRKSLSYYKNKIWNKIRGSDEANDKVVEGSKIKQKREWINYFGKREREPDVTESAQPGSKWEVERRQKKKKREDKFNELFNHIKDTAEHSKVMSGILSGTRTAKRGIGAVFGFLGSALGGFFKLGGPLGKIGLAALGISLSGYLSEFWKEKVWPGMKSFLFGEKDADGNQSKNGLLTGFKNALIGDGKEDGLLQKFTKFIGETVGKIKLWLENGGLTNVLGGLAAKLITGFGYAMDNIGAPLIALLIKSIPSIGASIIKGVVNGLRIAIGNKKIGGDKVSSEIHGIQKEVQSINNARSSALSDSMGDLGSSFKNAFNAGMASAAYTKNTYDSIDLKALISGETKNDQEKTILDKTLGSKSRTNEIEFDENGNITTEYVQSNKTESILSNLAKASATGFIRNAVGLKGGNALGKAMTTIFRPLGHFGKGMTAIVTGGTSTALNAAGHTLNAAGKAGEVVGDVIQGNATLGSSVASKINKVGEKLVEKANGGSKVAGWAADLLQKGTKKVAGLGEAATRATAKATEKGFGKAIKKFFKWLSNSKLVTAIGKFGKKFFGKKMGENAISTALVKIGESLEKHLLTKLAGKGAKKIAAGIANMTPAALAFILLDFTWGFNNAATLLMISKDDEAYKITVPQKIMCGLIHMINQKVTWGFIPTETIMDIVIEHIAPLFNMDTSELKDAQSRLKEEMDQWNREALDPDSDHYGEFYDNLEDYNNRDKWTTKMKKSIFGNKKIDEEKLKADYEKLYGEGSAEKAKGRSHKVNSSINTSVNNAYGKGRVDFGRANESEPTFIDKLKDNSKDGLIPKALTKIMDILLGIKKNTENTSKDDTKVITKSVVSSSNTINKKNSNIPDLDSNETLKDAMQFLIDNKKKTDVKKQQEDQKELENQEHKKQMLKDSLELAGMIYKAVKEDTGKNRDEEEYEYEDIGYGRNDIGKVNSEPNNYITNIKSTINKNSQNIKDTIYTTVDNAKNVFKENVQSFVTDSAGAASRLIKNDYGIDDIARISSTNYGGLITRGLITIFEKISDSEIGKGIIDGIFTVTSKKTTQEFLEKTLVKFADSLGETIIQKASKTALKSIAGFIGRFSPLSLVLAVRDFISGYNNAGAILGVLSEEVGYDISIPQKIVCGLVNVINLHFTGGLIGTDIIISLTMDYILPLFNVDTGKLTKARQDTLALMKKANKEGNKHYKNVSEYVKDKTPTFGQKVITNIKNLFDNDKGKGRNDILDIDNVGYGRHINQKSPDIANMKYGNSTIGEAGCGPVAATNLLNNIPGKKMSVSKAASYAEKKGFTDKDGGTDIKYFNSILNDQGVSTKNTKSKNEVMNALDSGNQVVMLGKDRKGGPNSPFGTDNHFITAVGRNKNGDIIAEDPDLPQSRRVYKKDRVMNSMMNSVITGKSIGRGRNDTFVGRANSEAMTDSGIGNIDEYTTSSSQLAAQNLAGKNLGPDAILNVARSQIGTMENPPNSNNQKYGAAAGNNGAAWCCYFVWWVFNQAGAANLFHGGTVCGRCTTLRDYHKAQKVSTPQKGDIVFFTFDGKVCCHVGIVESVNDDGSINTIEGNTSGSGSQDNGGAVMKKNRKPKHIHGYFRPKYPYDYDSSKVVDMKKFGDKNDYKMIAIQGGGMDPSLVTGGYDSTGFSSSSGSISASSSGTTLYDTIKNLGVNIMKKTFGEDAYNALFGDNAGSEIPASPDDGGTSTPGDMTSTDPSTIAGNSDIEKIYNYLIKKGYTKEGAAGLMGNLQQESGMRSNNLQNSYEKKLGMNDVQYTDAVNSKKRSKAQFSTDADGGYGLAQWTYSSRKKGLYENTIEKGKKIDDLIAQLDYLDYEINSGQHAKNVAPVLKSTNSVHEASDKVLTDFEGPAVLDFDRRRAYSDEIYNRFKNYQVKDEKNKSTDYYTQHMHEMGKGRNDYSYDVDSIATDAIQNYEDIGYAREDTPTSYRIKNINTNKPKSIGKIPTANNMNNPAIYASVLASIVEILTTISDNTGALNQILDVLSNNMGIDMDTNEVQQAASNPSKTKAKNALNKLIAQSMVNKNNIGDIKQTNETQYLVSMMQSLAKE